MKILLISVVAIWFAACYGNPTGYHSDIAEVHRDVNRQITRNLANEALKPLSSQEQFQTPRDQSHESRQEYRVFGKYALPQNSPTETPTINQDHKIEDVVMTSSQNPEVKDAFLNKNQINMLQTAAFIQDTQVPNSGFNQHHLRSDLSYSYDPASHIQTSSSQIPRRPFHQKDEDRTRTAVIHNRKVLQENRPFAAEQRSDIQTGVFSNQNIPGAKSSVFQDQFPQVHPFGYQNRNPSKINPISVQDQHLQNQGRFLDQNDMRVYHGVSQNNKQSLRQNPPFSQEGQTRTSPVSQERVIQLQKNQQSYIPLSALEKGNSFGQVRNNFESRRIPSTLHRQNQNIAEQKEIALISDQIPTNNLKGNEQIRHVENAQISTDIRSKDIFNKRDQVQNREQDVERRIQEVGQGLYQNLNREQAVVTLPQYRQSHTTSVLLSGTKGSPLVLYRTRSAASPYAVVISRDSTGALSKASVSQHLKTPYTHYTYTHAL